MDRHRLMKTFGCLAFAVLGVMAPCGGMSAQAQSIGFDDANWIWCLDAAPLESLPAAVTYFRAAVMIPESPALKSAEIIATADNLFVLYLNGQPVGESDADNSAWQRPKRWDVTTLLVPGRTVVAVEAVNTLPGPAGLIVKLVANLANGKQIVLASNATWTCSIEEEANWQQAGFDDQKWKHVDVIGDFGMGPWGKVAVPSESQPGGGPVGNVQQVTREILAQAEKQGHIGAVKKQVPPPEYVWPEALIFLGDDCSLYRPLQGTNNAMDSLSVTVFNPRKSRAFPEHDLPAPMKVGHTLYQLKPARPGVEPRPLLDAGKGGIGSPSVSFDGKTIYVSMAYQGDPFFHIYKLDCDGSHLEQLTHGPFHDIDPAELPDGRLVFSSTRIGSFEEYHSPPSRALYVMDADGSHIEPLTHTIIFDNEPEVLADGRILFIRSDNFFDRGKVETLLHAIQPDGTDGMTEFGLDNGPEYGVRLRANLCGSPAPMPDGRVAFVSGPGITVGQLGTPSKHLQHYSLAAGDVAALPNGQLLCTTASRVSVTLGSGDAKRTAYDLSYETIAILDPSSRPPTLVTLYESNGKALHSPVFLGERVLPPVLAERVDKTQTTGFLFCQDARFTKNVTAGWSHVRAIRVLAGKGLTTRSSHSYIVHAGNETVELGTVPLAPDGSFSIEVPADTPIALQAVDAEGRSELNEMSWVYVRPGEQRGCVGCHHTRQSTPMVTRPRALALNTAPLKLLGQGQPHRFRGNNAAVTGLMELQFDRYREVAGINRHSETVNPLATGAEEVGDLIRQLRGSDSGLKISAAQRLSIFRDPAAASTLADCLHDRNREVQVAAALSLSTCGTRDSVPPLFTALTSKDPLVAQAAAVALENITGHSQPFNAFAPFKTRSAQAQAWRQWFANTTWEQIELTLIERLQSPDTDGVRRAAVALGHTGAEAAGAAIRAYVTEARQNNPFPAWQRGGNIGDNARFNAASRVNPRTLQAATRALGHLRDIEAVPLLSETLRQYSDPATGNLFLAEAAVEALGRIGSPAAQTALVTTFSGLKNYQDYTLWYGDHPALMACHASPVHYFIAEALDGLGSMQAGPILLHLIRALPVDPDRALFLNNDDFETLVGRVIRRHGKEASVVETCLAMLGDAQAKPTQEIQEALSTINRCWGGHPSPENRAAQVLSLVCRDRAYEPRVRAVLERYRRRPVDIPRVFDTGIPEVLTLPAKHWVCFFAARTLGNLNDPRSTEALTAILEHEPAEGAYGYPDPLGPGVLFLHNDLTPCWRAAVAWALGRIGDHSAVPVLLDTIGNLDNALDTRHAAAEALAHCIQQADLARIQKLAADYPESSTRRVLLDLCEQTRTLESTVASAN
ncbi:MAG: HEAT repeat domain-containing protein [Phycisphaerae bacterium]|nr:HEAT repeat domain-containing protein [Phycisphaerae bacterium]